MKKIIECIKTKLNIRSVVRRCGLYTAKDMVDFANWYGNAVYYSEGNCGNAMFIFQDYENGVSSDLFIV